MRRRPTTPTSWRLTIRTPTRRTAAASTLRGRRIFVPLVLAVAACGGEVGPAGEADAAPDTAPALAAEPDPDLVAPPAPVARQILETEEGEATYYADLFQGRRTASGEAFDQGAMMAAHLRYPFGTRLRVTEPSSERSVEVRVVDRGPYAKGRRMPAIIDLSKAAARRLGILDQGRAVVTVEVLEWGEGLPVAG